MATGNRIDHSPIVQAIQEAEKNTTGEIRVHLSKKWIENDPFQRAMKLFKEFKMHQTTYRNGILLYINLRRKKFAIFGDEGINHVIEQRTWNKLAQSLAQNLRSTQSERAIAETVRAIGDILKEHFPADLDGHNPNELSDDISHD